MNCTAKKLLLILISVTSANTLMAQVGINTENPQGVFHIDAARDNSASPTPVQTANDVAVTSQGNVGLGTLTPEAKLEVNGQVKITGGNPNAGKILTSDTNGLATWEQPGFSQFTRLENAAFSVLFKNAPTPMVLKQADGTPYIIDFKTEGTFSLTAGVQIRFKDLGNAKIKFIIIQLLPADDHNLWYSRPLRFRGSYEIYGVQGQYPWDWRFYMSENITTTASLGFKAYVAAQVEFEGTPNSVEADVFIGDNDICPQCVGGSFVKIN